MFGKKTRFNIFNFEELFLILGFIWGKCIIYNKNHF